MFLPRIKKKKKMQICFRLALNLWRKVKRGVFLSGNTCIADRANRFFYPSKQKKLVFAYLMCSALSQQQYLRQGICSDVKVLGFWMQCASWQRSGSKTSWHDTLQSKQTLCQGFWQQLPARAPSTHHRGCLLSRKPPALSKHLCPTQSNGFVRVQL